MSLENLFENLNLNLSETDSVESADLDPDIDNNQFLIMAQFKPEYLNCVAQFDGNPNELNRFLSSCESIITNFYDNANVNNFQNVFLLNSLINKLTGNARVVVNIQNVSTWNELKNTLRRNFADQRDEACLNRDLVLLRQSMNEKPQQYFDRCLHILNLLCSYVDIHEQTADAKLLKRNLYNKLALKTFLSGLKEPLGNNIRCMRPNDLNEALQFIMEEENIQYYQNNSNRNFNKQSQLHNVQPQRTQNNLNKSQFSNNAGNYFPQQNFQQHQHFPKFNQFIPRTYNNQSQNVRGQFQNFAQPQQQFSANFQNYKQPQQNVFKPNPNRTFPKPTPMSISTRQTYAQPTTSQYRPQRNFVSEELYNAEVDESNQYDDIEQTNELQYEQCEQHNEEIFEEQNFQLDHPFNDQT